MFCKILKLIPTVGVPALCTEALAWIKVFWGGKESGE